MDPNATARSKARPKARRVALVAMDPLDRDALSYALNACERLDACLDILTSLAPEEVDRQVMGMRGRADTLWRVFRIGGEGDDDFLRYSRNESGLLFFVSSAGDEQALRLRNSSGPDRLPPRISWVTVESR